MFSTINEMFSYKFFTRTFLFLIVIWSHQYFLWFGLFNHFVKAVVLSLAYLWESIVPNICNIQYSSSHVWVQPFNVWKLSVCLILDFFYVSFCLGIFICFGEVHRWSKMVEKNLLERVRKFSFWKRLNFATKLID